MSTVDNPKTLYVKYFEEFGVIPDKPEYFIAFCRKYNVTLKYKDCRQLFQNPPVRTNRAESLHLTDQSGDDEDDTEQQPITNITHNIQHEELKYHHIDENDNDEDDTNNHSPANHSNNSNPSESLTNPSSKHTIIHHHQHQQSPSPGTPTPISLPFTSHSHSNKNNSTKTSIKPPNFQLLNGSNKHKKLTDSAVELTMDRHESNYLSPEILVDKMIPLNDKMNIISYHRDLNELTINKCPLYRDSIFFILYWIGLINGIIDIYNFEIWYFRFLSVLLWLCVIAISLICHHYYKSPPYYPVYYESDCRYLPKLDKSAMEYITEWNKKEKSQDNLENERYLGIKLFYIEMYGGLSESKCGYVEINVKKIVDKSVDILQDILKYGKNKLIRLRIYHVLRFRDHESHNKFQQILKGKETEHPLLNVGRVDKMWHIEYNQDIEDRLILNTTRNMENNGYNIWDGWNECCINKRCSYFWYIAGFGFCYRFYHDCCIQTKIYDCVKEVTL